MPQGYSGLDDSGESAQKRFVCPLVDDGGCAWTLSLGHSALQFPLGSKWYTELDHDGQVALHLGRSLCVLLPALVLHM